MSPLRIHPEVSQSLQSGTPVVALETAVVTHGLPRKPLKLPRELQFNDWNANEPVNLELARLMSRTVREAGAIPAMIAVIDGVLHIGLDDNQLTRLAHDESAAKCAAHTLAHAITSKHSAGTTVSATLAACGLTHTSPSLPHQSPNRQIAKSPDHTIRVFATGGIGGVHRNWQQLPDISADLRAIANTPVCVVCSGAKSILDLPATLEILETLGVPVLGYRTNAFPQFQCAADDSLKLDQRIDDIASAAATCIAHWNTLQSTTGVILANPVPSAFALKQDELQDALHFAEQLASSRQIAGSARTPFLLDQVAQRTQNRSLIANLALLHNNARLAAELAVTMAKMH